MVNETEDTIDMPEEPGELGGIEVSKYVNKREIEALGDDWIDHNQDHVCKHGAMEKCSSFLRRNNFAAYKEKQDQFYKILVDNGILCVNPGSNMSRKYYWNKDVGTYKRLFKLIKE